MMNIDHESLRGSHQAFPHPFVIQLGVELLDYFVAIFFKELGDVIDGKDIKVLLDKCDSFTLAKSVKQLVKVNGNVYICSHISII